MKAKRWILAKHFQGAPTEENIQLVEVELPELKDKEVLLKALYLSVDPYMKPYSRSFPNGSTMIGEQLAEVIQTKNGEFPLGTIVLAKVGWQSHFISDGSNLEPIPFDLGSTPKSYCLGSLGMPGATAYFGLYKICDPKPGETVVVNGAAGAVGSIVGQLAKIKGCRVIAFAGSDEKVNWCKNELGFDHVFNYRRVNFSDEIKKLAPEGVDVFFDNVGGDFFHTVVGKHMKRYGRVSCCGSIDNYNDTEIKSYPAINFALVQNEVNVKGFIVTTYKKEWPQAFVEMKKYIDEGKLKVRETTYEGFDRMRDAFYGLFTGENIGKAIVKA